MKTVRKNILLTTLFQAFRQQKLKLKKREENKKKIRINRMSLVASTINDSFSSLTNLKSLLEKY
jgi:hypothetical protein